MSKPNNNTTTAAREDTSSDTTDPVTSVTKSLASLIVSTEGELPLTLKMLTKQTGSVLALSWLCPGSVVTQMLS